MKNFDTIIGDVKVNAKAAASAVSKKAAMLYDASKHRISAETIKRSIGKKLIELGKLTYKATTQDIDLAKQNLAIVEAHIASIKNQKICPECENKVTKESSFCNICGHKFEDEPEEAVEEIAEAVEEAAETVEAKPDDIVVAAQEAVAEISEDAGEAVKAADDAE